MKFTTITLKAIELTHEEEHVLWEKYKSHIPVTILGKKLIHWNTKDGHNAILLNDNYWYQIVYK